MTKLFDGVLSRRSYMLALVSGIVVVIIAALGCSLFGIIGRAIAGTPGHMIGTMGSYAILVAGVVIWKATIMTRRLRDAGRSPYWTIAYFVPILLSMEFTAGSNGVGFHVNGITILTLLIFEPFLMIMRSRHVTA